MVDELKPQEEGQEEAVRGREDSVKWEHYWRVVTREPVTCPGYPERAGNKDLGTSNSDEPKDVLKAICIFRGLRYLLKFRIPACGVCHTECSLRAERASAFSTLLLYL